jgi:RNA polymerase sigma-70 factor, ECF subfamily
MNIIQQAKAGSMEAISQLYTENKDKVYRTILFMVHNRSEAEDLTQDTFVQVMKYIRTFKEEAKFSTWVHRIAVNTVLMKNRQKKNLILLEGLEAAPPRVFHMTDRELNNTVNRLSIQYALKTLPRGQRKIFQMHLMENVPHKEVAETLGISKGTSKSQLHKAKEKMQNELKRYCRS